MPISLIKHAPLSFSDVDPRDAFCVGACDHMSAWENDHYNDRASFLWTEAANMFGEGPAWQAYVNGWNSI